MSSILGGLWSILLSYRPNAARDRQTVAPARFGAFEARYRPTGWGVRRPYTDKEAQALYNHIRTVAFWLDAAPLLSDLGLPFRAGLDDIISLVPLYGDLISGILQLYQVWMSFIFGVPRNIIGYMLLNVVIDIVVGIVPLIGDFLDNLFKSNLRNLALLEEWLLTHPTATKYHILLMPEGTEFMPKPKTPRFSNSWFGGGRGSEVDKERERERVQGRVRKTRRMGREESAWEVPVGNAGGGTRRGDPVFEPLD